MRSIQMICCTVCLFALTSFTTAQTSEDSKPSATPTPSPSSESKGGINDRFLDPELDPTLWAKRWESESREIFVAREAIVEAMRLTPGMAVADIGAGTGLFVPLFAEKVTESGEVHARDIAPKFIEYLTERAKEHGLSQVEARVSHADSADLAKNSIDVAFVCDTYHHFDEPQKMLASIHEALKPNGTLIVVDFERIEGKSREWVLNHVRAGKETVTQEIESAGFHKVEEVKIETLKENYFLRFTKLPAKALYQ